MYIPYLPLPTPVQKDYNSENQKENSGVSEE